MRKICLALLAALVCVAVGVRASDVVDATDAEFDNIIKSSDFVMMEFYAPWCGHCKKLEPEYDEAATKLKGVATLAKLDATVEKAAAGKYDIKGFPTIKIFRDGALAGDYEGGRTAADIVKYVKGNVGPAVKALVSGDELASFKAENPVAVVAAISTGGGDAFDAFETVAKKLRGSYAFGLVTDASLVDASDNSVVMFKDFDDNRAAFDGDVKSADAIEEFVAANGVPLFDEIGPHNYQMYLKRGLPMAWLFATSADTVAMEAGKAVAPSLKGKLSFVWIDSGKYAGMAGRLGLSGDKFPALAIDHEGTHYAMPADQDVNEANVKAFTQSYVDGTLQPTVKSEDAPAEHTVDGLTTVVGSTFDDLVANADVDVLIEFYAPWCGHCKSLAPVYEELAKNFAESPVRIAKIDATANDFDQKKFNVGGFPTLFFVPKSTHEPVQYEGGRTLEAFTEYIKQRI